MFHSLPPADPKQGSHPAFVVSTVKCCPACVGFFCAVFHRVFNFATSVLPLTASLANGEVRACLIWLRHFIFPPNNLETAEARMPPSMKKVCLFPGASCIVGSSPHRRRALLQREASPLLPATLPSPEEWGLKGASGTPLRIQHGAI